MTSSKSSLVTLALWEAVEQKWEDPSVHDSFLNACAEENDLAYAARKYREQKDGPDGARHELAQRQLEKITSMAFAQMATQKTQPSENKKTITIVAALVSGALLIACLYLLTL